MRIPFVGGAYESPSLPWAAQRCVNWYVKPAEQEAKTPAALFPRPGLTALVTLSAGAEVRGLWPASDGHLYAVAGSGVYQIDTTFAATQIATLTTHTGAVAIRDNGNQLIVADGAFGYTYAFATGTWAQITDPGFPDGTNQVEFQDSYFIAVEPNSQRFWISGVGNGNAWSAQDTASAEGRPDNLVGLVSSYRELWLFGERTSEVWFNTGNATFPFERSQNAFIEVGCAAAGSIVKMDNTVYWLGNDDRGSRVVWRAEGYIPRIVSTDALTAALDEYGTIDDAVGFSFSQGGHTFYVLTFPTEDKTWVFDAKTQMWFEWLGFDNGEFHRWQPNCYASFVGLHVVGGHNTGKLYALNPRAYTDDGETIKRLRTTPSLSEENTRLFFASLEVDLEPGIGLSSGQGSDPTLMLRWSNDGGRTWSNQITASAGAIGRTEARARFRRLGSARNRVWEISATDPVKWVVYGAYAQLAAGAH